MDTLSNANSTPVPLLDLSRQIAPLHDEIIEAVSRIVQSCQFVLGPDVRELESTFAEYCQAKHAVGCASGSEALLLALMASEISPGDEVIVPSYTFFATASAVTRLGAKAVFVDINPATFNLDPHEVAKAVTPRTKAVIPVHLYGQCADMDAICQIGREHSLTIIEDAAQAVGAEYQGRRAGSIGDIGCFSFYPTKNLGAAGDAGMLTTNNDQLAERLALLRVHGMQPRYYHQIVGINSRIDSIQAAVLSIKMRHLDAWTRQRTENAHRYTELFAGAGLDGFISLPPHVIDGRHIWNQYIVRIPGGQRDALRQFLTENQIGTEIYYPVPLHLQACFADQGYGLGSLPHTETAAKETLALPIFPELTEEEQQSVVCCIGRFFQAARNAA
jgi:dTDP-4-amino-4,6-dideoxygalactose transaminase